MTATLRRRVVRVIGALRSVPAWVLARAATYAGNARTEVLDECVVKYNKTNAVIIPPTPAWLVEVEAAYSGIPASTGHTSSGFLFSPSLFNPSSSMAEQQRNRAPDLDVWFLAAFASRADIPAAMRVACFDSYCSRLYYAEHGSNPPSAYFTYVAPNLSTIMVNIGNAVVLVGFNQAFIPVGVQDGDTVTAYAGLVTARESAISGLAASAAFAAASNYAAAEMYGSVTVSGGEYFAGENPRVANPEYFYPVSGVDSYGLTVSAGIRSGTVLLEHLYGQGSVFIDWYSVRVTISGTTYPSGGFVEYSDNGARYAAVLYSTHEGGFSGVSFSIKNDYSIVVNGVVVVPSAITLGPRIGWASAAQFKNGYYEAWLEAVPPYVNVAAKRLWVYAPVFNPLAVASAVEIFTPPTSADYNPSSGAMFNFATGAIAYFTVTNLYQLGLARALYQSIKSGVTLVEDRAAALVDQKSVILSWISVQFNNGVSDDWIAFGAEAGKLTTVISAQSMYDV